MDFTKEEYQRRLKKVQKMMQEKGIELLISHDTNNLNYLTGYDAWSFYYAQCAIVHINAEELFCVYMNYSTLSIIKRPSIISCQII